MFQEIQFWTNRLKNLESIYDQMRDERVKKMASILEHTDSAYFPCFKSVFKNVVGGKSIRESEICFYSTYFIKLF